MELFPELPLILIGYGLFVLTLKVFAERISPGRVSWNNYFVRSAVLNLGFGVLWLVIGTFYRLVSD